MSETLQDKTYIVTGASKGFGLAITRALLAQGAMVGMLARDDDTLQEAVQELDSDQVFGIAGDVASGEKMNQAFQQFRDHFGGLSGLINNAGVARPGKVEKLTSDDLMLQINTNYVGTVLCCQAAIPLLRGAANPRIINISSASAWHYDEMYHLSIYASTKAAVERFSRDLRLELQEEGIGVTCIRPGAAWTHFSDGWNAGDLQAGVDAWHNAGPTMDSGMEPEHVADAVTYCLGYPPGVAVDLLEVRPNRRIPKLQL
ncbi:MAG: SDR family NAD(P)-dependent oxidoreductase [Gammaproteobacteria bacterium]|nr:SDR family NAD(P)-dependent oxidoreductase [Gammaproteobacteria bacterium]